MSLIVKQLDSGYRHRSVIHEINFEIQAGQICALVGLNGAGKSTLLKTILGLLQPQKGQVILNGCTLQANHEAYAKQIAYIPETPVLYEELTLKEHIEMTALGYGMAPEEALAKAQPYLEQFRLAQHLSWFPTHFSKGMKQKVMIICALITQAQLLIIDEPFLGLDPIAIRDFSLLLKRHAQQGGMVLLTTHVLSIASELADQYLMLRAGRLVAQGDLAALQAQLGATTEHLDDLYMMMAEAGETR